VSAPDLSVVVVTHNGRGLALTTLRSARSRTGGLEVEWIVADSGSSDGTPAAIEREMPDVRVIRCANLGFAHANNRGLEVARGRYLLLLNPDVEIERGTLAGLVAELERRPGVGVASGIQRGTDGALLPSIRRFPSPARDLGESLRLNRLPGLGRLGELDLNYELYGEERSVDWLSGAFLLVRREAAMAAGGLDERFFLYSEEIDWCLRIRGAGWDVRHLPAIEIVHHCGGSSPERAAELARSRVLFARKHFGAARAAAIRLALAAGHLVRVVPLLAAGTLVPSVRPRLRAEALALAVTLGATDPPLSAKARATARADAPFRPGNGKPRKSRP
jgi:GT2 family glycosyltransferase